MGIRGQIVDSVQQLIQRGDREIVWSPQSGLGFGNMLYAYLYAAGKQAEGVDCRVLNTPVMGPWLERFRSLADLTIESIDVSWRDQRQWVWNSRFGEDFTRSDLQRFIVGNLLVAPSADPDAVVINVRRGDYYDAPHFRGTYSFDIASYLQIALQRAGDAGPVSRIVFVSDGVDWCRLKLDALARGFAAEVEYFDTHPIASFERVASARRIIGTNSSFSYWAAYVSGVIHHDTEHVVMPRFHARLGEDWSAYQLDPAWDVVDDIPGGWNA